MMLIRPSNFIVKFLQDLPAGTYTVGSTETTTKITVYTQDGANTYETGATSAITAASPLTDIGATAALTAGNHMIVYEFTADTYARILYDGVGTATAVTCPPGATTLTYTDKYNAFPGCSGDGSMTAPTIATTTPPTFGNSLGQLTDLSD